MPRETLKGPGVRSQILLTVVGVVLAGFGLLHVFTMPLIDSTVKRARIAEEQRLADGLAREVGATAPETLEARLSELSEHFQDSCLALVRGDGVAIFDGRRSLARCLAAGDVDASLADNVSRIAGEGSATSLSVSAALPPGPAADSIGPGARLVVASSLAAAEDQLDVTRKLLLLFMVAAIGLVCLIGYGVLTELISRPLQRTATAIDRVAAGDLDVVARDAGGRELRAVAASLNALARKLKDDQSRIGHQITELKLINEKLESAREKLVRSEKLASVGKLAAGVAHEIGNPIAIVLGYLEMMDRPDVTDEERKSFIAQSHEAAQRVSGIIRDLLDFSRPDPDGEEPCIDVVHAIQRSLALVGPQKRFKRVAVTTSLPETPVVAAIGEHRLQQVLVNLLLNAADATEGRESPEVRVSTGHEDGKVVIHIEDNGAGMPPAVRRRLFDPFFTTKEPGKGTGLGLSICYSIVTSCGGDIAVDSTSGHGARFTLTLPVASQSVKLTS